MENVGQQTEYSSREHETSCCVKVWPYICTPVVGIVFLGLALLFAILYSGYGTKSLNTVHDGSIIQMRHSQKDIINFTRTRQVPYIGALISKKPYMFLCAAVILTNRYLLSGANCLITNLQNMHVRVGSSTWNSNGSVYDVQYFKIHDDFNGETLENNIAVLKVQTVIVLNTNIKKIKIVTSNVLTEDKGIVLGWNTWSLRVQDHTRLMEQELFIWKPAKCQNYLNETSSKFICASLNTTLCNLGVTGPFMIGGKLAGFWSWGLSCLNTPSVFTNLQFFKPWILEKTTN